MLNECFEFLEGRCETSNFRYELIIVNDGSNDKTSMVAEKYVRQLGIDKVRLLDLQINRGKGGAVRLVSLLYYKKKIAAFS